jgi:hypothetical protein
VSRICIGITGRGTTVFHGKAEYVVSSAGLRDNVILARMSDTIAFVSMYHIIIVITNNENKLKSNDVPVTDLRDPYMCFL